MSSIPSGYPSNRRPVLSGGRKLFLVGLVAAPILSYAVLKRRQSAQMEEKRTVEEEGRRNWIVQSQQLDAGNENNKRGAADSMSVAVGRSGGGV